MENKNAPEIEGFTIDYDLPLYSGDMLWPVFDTDYDETEFDKTNPIVVVYHRKTDGQTMGHGLSPYVVDDIPKSNIEEWIETIYNEACEKLEIPDEFYIRVAILEKNVIKPWNN